ncbi:unnamed protein product [Linum tenue]|uniref:NAD-dependent epimerase/dehydratase domain-containing protein n=1 Tax=Linum tenue TaxID=586396 RepID=A0AAV0KF72_9ROSI|nr:unnamed protein product [Linum tenue]
MSAECGVVCVTGGSGYIASWIIKLLLERGYTVKTTVRDPDDKTKTQHLLSLDGANERLQLYKADLTAEGSFDSAVDGCQAVFHTASPVLFQTTDLIDPAVKGTLNVLKSCAKMPSVKRVVLTSSMASVVCNRKPLSAGVVIDETWFSDPEFCAKYQHWYMLSKTLAEEAAWKFANENGIDLVAVNPGFVIGPFLQPSVNFTVEEVLRLINGNRAFPSDIFRFVDVRDVANAHIQAFEVPSASGRCCVVGSMVHYTEALKIMHELYPNLPLSGNWENYETFQPQCKISQEKAKSLGVNFTPLEVSLRDTVECLKEKGLVSF